METNNGEHIFEVVIPSDEKVGLILDHNKKVSSIVGGEQAWVFVNGGVKVGDVLYAVNGEEIRNVAIRDIAEKITNASTPKSLSFLTVDGLPRSVPHMLSPLTYEESQKRNISLVNPYMELFSGGRKIASMEVANSQFGTNATCRSFKIVFAKPENGCTQLKNKVQGFLVVVERGQCSFTSKAAIIQSAQGSGMIVVNSKKSGPIFAMPVDDSHGPSSITIPAVMISMESMELIKDSLKHHSFHGGVKAKLVTVKECYKGKGHWHSDPFPEVKDENESNELIQPKYDRRKELKAKGQVDNVEIMFEEDAQIIPALQSEPSKFIEPQEMTGGKLEVILEDSKQEFEFLTLIGSAAIPFNREMTIGVIGPDETCLEVEAYCQSQAPGALVLIDSLGSCELDRAFEIFENHAVAVVAVISQHKLIHSKSIESIQPEHQHAFGTIVLSRNEGLFLLSKLQNGPTNVTGMLQEDIEVVGLWQELRELSDPENLPSGSLMEAVIEGIKRRHVTVSSAKGSLFRAEIFEDVFVKKVTTPREILSFEKEL